MKVAFLFAGQLRSINHKLFDKSIDLLTKKLDYGIFCYSWNEPGKSFTYQSKKPEIENRNDSKDRINELFKNYNLIDLRTESYQLFIDNLDKKYKKISNSKEFHHGTFNSLPQIYTLNKCYKSFSPYLDQYDLIFRCRFDSLFIHPLQMYPLSSILRSNSIYNLNFGRAYYPERIYDIFFGGSTSAMSFLNDIWRNLPDLINNDFDNKLDKRDACRIFYLAAKSNNLKIRSLESRICDIYREGVRYSYESYLLKSHLISLKFKPNSLAVFKFFIYWCSFRNKNVFKLFLDTLKTFLILPLSYLKRIKYLKPNFIKKNN